MTNMQNLYKVCKILTLFTFFISVNTIPLCKTGQNQQHVVCTAGDNDFEYILRRGLVSDNNVTTHVTLRGCRISDVDYEAFHHMFSLVYIDLSVNNIHRLKLGVLDGDERVTHLNLSYNLLIEFPLGLFDQKPNLEMLDLKGNKISSLKVGVFNPLHKLRFLDLSSNLIVGEKFNPHMFDHSRIIGFMDFSRNDMSNTPENLLQAFEALDFLNLDRCVLKSVPKFATRHNLKNMNHLMLSTNQISIIDDSKTFIELDELKILNLAENNINQICGEVFKPLKKLILIVLRGNKLKILPNSLFQNFPKLSEIDLSFNSLEYVSAEAFIGTPLTNLNVAANRFTYLQDNFCLELIKSGARLQKFYFHQNPWQIKAFGVQYDSVKYKGEEPVCVTTSEFNCKRQQIFNEYFIKMYDNLF